jgi:trigger factor
MQVLQNNIDALNAELTVEINSNDYQGSVEKALKDYRKKAQLPGFRPGHVPASLIKQRYGKAMLAEEVNKMLQDAIYKHISDNKLAVLGSPIPKADGETGDWDNPGDFTFVYEIGLAPNIEVELNDKMKFEYTTVAIDDKLIDRQVKDYSRRFGKMSEPEVSGADDLLDVTFQAIDSEGQIIEGGVNNNTTVIIDDVKDAGVRAQMTGLSKGSTLDLDPFLLSGDHESLSRMLGISHHDLHHFENHVRITVNSVHHIEPAEWTQELFDKIYPAGEVSSMDQMRVKISEELTKVFAKDSDWLFKRSMATTLVETVNPSLPDDFMKRWIMMSNNNPITMEQVEGDYPAYSNSVRWQLIESAIIEKEGIQVTVDDAMGQVKAEYASRFAQYGIPVDEERLDAMAKELLAKRDEAKNVYDSLFENKVMEVVKAKCTIVEKSMSFDEFVHQVQHAH